MKRTDAAGATVGNLFTDGDPIGGVPATHVEETWLNSVQEEICNVIEAAGITLNEADDDQLLEAINLLIATGAIPKSIVRRVVGFGVAINGADAVNDIDIAAGFVLSDDKTTIFSLASAITKRLDATFTAGNNGGGLDTGSKANTTTYHVFAIYNPTTLATDVIFSTSLASPTMPSGFTKKRRIASLRTNGSAAWQTFQQRGNQFLLTALSTDISTTTQGTTSVLYAMPSPAGLKLELLVNFIASAASNNLILVTDPDLSITAAPAGTVAPIPSMGDALSTTAPAGAQRVFSNTSSQIRVCAGAANTTVRGGLMGWIDERELL